MGTGKYEAEKNAIKHSEDALKSWFDPLDITWNAESRHIQVLFPHRFFGARFAALFRQSFEDAARELWGTGITFDYGIVPLYGPVSEKAGDPLVSSARFAVPAGTAASESGIPPFPAPQACVHPALVNPSPFGEDRTFGTFIANGKHKWVLTLARDLVRHAVHGMPGGAAAIEDKAFSEPPGLLVLCGGHGTGKTHVLCAVGNELFRTLGQDLYFASVDDFMARFMKDAGARLAVRRDLAGKRALLIDDVQRLGTAEASFPEGEAQNELCLLLDRFMEQGKAVVMAGAGHPRDWHLDKGLLSRLETGLWAELPEPDLDVRLRYAQQQARQKRLPLNKDLLLLLAQHCTDIRRLSGLIRRVASHRALLGRDISEQDILNIIRQGADPSALTPQIIISIVGEHCGIPAREILGEKRRPDLVQARQMAMYLCRELLGHSYPVIGRMFGGKDHSTVMHGVKKIKQLQEHDRLVHTMVTELTKACRERRS